MTESRAELVNNTKTQNNETFEHIYHEKQTVLQCGRHCVNNILQGPIFSKEDFDIIARRLKSLADLSGAGEQGASRRPQAIRPWYNWLSFDAHHINFLGWGGDYDINVVEAALASKGYDVEWYDLRKSIDQLCLPPYKDGYSSPPGLLSTPTDPNAPPMTKDEMACVALIVNIPLSSLPLLPFYNRRHYIAFRFFDSPQHTNGPSLVNTQSLSLSPSATATASLMGQSRFESKCSGIWWNLDSVLQQPVPIGDANAVRRNLQHITHNHPTGSVYILKVNKINDSALSK